VGGGPAFCSSGQSSLLQTFRSKDLPPVRPLLLGSQNEWGMFSDLARYPQVIKPFHYTDDEMLMRCLESDVIQPAERRARELAGR
jgi:hypothetical protein